MRSASQAENPLDLAPDPGNDSRDRERPDLRAHTDHLADLHRERVHRLRVPLQVPPASRPLVHPDVLGKIPIDLFVADAATLHVCLLFQLQMFCKEYTLFLGFCQVLIFPK